MEEELAADTVEYAVGTAWYVSMVEKVVCTPCTPILFLYFYYPAHQQDYL